MPVTCWICQLRRRRALFAALLFSALGLPISADPGDSKPVLLSTKSAEGRGWANMAELKKAAEAHDPKACFQYGEALLRGEDVKQDVAQGLLFLNEAADAGEAKAAFRLGKIYDDGELAPQDYAKAFEYYRAAARGGAAEAQYNLGVLYASARGTKRDYVEGLAWLIVATKNGAAGDGEQKTRAHLTKTKRQELIVSAERRSAEILKDLAAASIPVEPDKTTYPLDRPPSRIDIGGPPSRVSLGAPAALAGPPDISKNVAALVAKNRIASPVVNLQTPRQTVLHWDTLIQLKEEADSGTPAALWALGKVHLDGDLVPADPGKAIQLLEKAAAAGNSDAAYQLGEVYSKNTYTQPDDAKVFAYFQQAARARVPVPAAFYNLGACYVNGRGTPKDPVEGLAWLIVAKNHDVDPRSEGRIRAALNTSDPGKSALAEKRATQLEQELFPAGEKSVSALKAGK